MAADGADVLVKARALNSLRRRGPTTPSHAQGAVALGLIVRAAVGERLITLGHALAVRTLRRREGDRRRARTESHPQTAEHLALGRQALV